MILPNDSAGAVPGCDSLSTVKADSCQAADAAFQRLLSLALAVEGDLMRATIDFLQACRAEDAEANHEASRRAASIHEAWLDVLDDHGISHETIEKEGPPRHNTVKTLLALVDGEEDQKQVLQIKSHLNEFLTNQ